MRNLILAGLLFCFSFSNVHAQLSINEIMASNESVLADTNGEYDDWVEIYNAGASSINIGGLFVSDDPAIPGFWQIPTTSPSETTIPAGGFLILWADKQPLDGATHLNLKLSASGESIGLYQSNGDGTFTTLDEVSFGAQTTDISYGRTQDGGADFEFFAPATPGTSNNGATLSRVADAPIFSIGGGLYESAQTIALSTVNAEESIYYTLDASDPTTGSTLYTGPITITSNSVIRAISGRDGYENSQSITHTYFVGENSNIRIVSVVSDPDNLFSDENGIMVAGTNGVTGKCSDIPVNWNQDWEVPVNVELFEADGTLGFNQALGTSIFGGCSRRKPAKSLGIYARSSYGDNRVRYKLFKNRENETFKSFVLRNTGNDFNVSHIRDAFMTQLVRPMELDYQEYEPCILFINGQYWGQYNIREKVSEHFIENNNPGVESDSVNLLEEHDPTAKFGSIDEFVALTTFVENNDLAQTANYQHVSDELDIENFIDYQIAEIYVDNHDWPKNNFRYWNTKGSKWKYVLFDTDLGFKARYDDNTLAWAKADTASRPSPESTFLFRQLLKNEDFTNRFVQKFAARIGITFDPTVAKDLYRSMRNIIEPEMVRHFDRWSGFEDRTYETWAEDSIRVNRFADLRPEFMFQFIEECFPTLGEKSELTVNIMSPGAGEVSIMKVAMTTDSFTGLMYNDVPIELSAKANPGYSFKEWSIDGSTETDLTITITGNQTVNAIFIADNRQEVFDLRINELMASNNSEADPAGNPDAEYDDWIEIYNQGSVAVDLGGLYIWDNLGLPTDQLFLIPSGHSETVIPAGGYLRLWCDDQPEQGPLHLGFKLSQGGESIGLYIQQGDSLYTVDEYTFGVQQPDISTGAYPNGSEEWQSMKNDTPGSANLPASQYLGLYINEVVSQNETGLTDEQGQFVDWLEVYNSTSAAIDLGGFFISDDLSDLAGFKVSSEDATKTTVPAGGFIRFFADNNAVAGPEHLAFKLSSSGEEVFLLDPDSVLLHRLEFGPLAADYSFGLVPDGSSSVNIMNQVTPAASNIAPANCQLTIDGFKTVSISLIGSTDGQMSYDVFNAVPPFAVQWTDSIGSTVDPDAVGQGLYLVTVTDAIGCTSSDSVRMSEPVPRPLVKGLYINEIMADNSATIGDPDATDAAVEYDDWIELYNAGPDTINLAGLYFWDGLTDPYQDMHEMPATDSIATTMLPGAFKVLWADKSVEQGINHLDFSLKKGGEAIGIFQLRNGVLEVIDTISFGEQSLDQTIGRLPDGGASIGVLNPPTPGSTNINNLPPVVTAPTDLSIVEDGSAAAMVTFSDPEGDPIIVEFISTLSELAYTYTSDTLTLTPVADYFGAGQVRVEVSDPYTTITKVINVAIKRVNDPPVFTIDQSVVNKLQDATDTSFVIATLEPAVFGEEGDQVNFALTSDLDSLNQLANVSIDSLTGKVQISLRTDGGFGSQAFTISATDDGLDSLGVVAPARSQNEFALNISQVLGITGNQLSNQKFDVYPNPTSNNISWGINDSYKGTLFLKLIDLKGQVIYEKNLEKSQEAFESQVSLERLSSGIYHLMIVQEGQDFYLKKVIKK